MPGSAQPPVVTLSIAGSDNSAGAGIQADLKTFSAFGTYGLTAVTCIVAEVPGHVESVQPVEPEIVAAQVRLSLESFPVGAVKTGMLFSREIIVAVAGELASWPHLPLVIDPVMIATSGDPLITEGAVDIYKKVLFPKATLVTPNLDEAGALLGRPVPDLDAMQDAGRELAQTYGTAFLLKGGHLRGTTATDLLFTTDEVHVFEAPYIEGVSTHGTGCTYSAAITAGLAKGFPLKVSVRHAKDYVTRAIQLQYRWNTARLTTDALNHSVPSGDGS